MAARRQGQEGAVAFPRNVESWYCHPSNPYKMRKTQWFQHQNLDNFLGYSPRQTPILGMVYRLWHLSPNCTLAPRLRPSVPRLSPILVPPLPKFFSTPMGKPLNTANKRSVSSIRSKSDASVQIVLQVFTRTWLR